MAKLKVDQFVDLVKRSGLVDDERLSQALSGIDQSVKDSGIVASSLTKAGLLTEWQSEKLLQGRHKGFYLGKYKLLNHIGTGGMGSVYLAEHRVMRHRVAIKLLPSSLAAHPSYLERFHQEARASARLNHPNMVKATDVDNDENLHYLVMEFVDGADLQAIVSRSGPLPYRVAAEYTRQAAEGLAYAHQAGLIHRDIKPANLLVDNAGTVKILDMGLARFTDDSQGSLTKEYDQKMIGTVDYLAPEQALDSHQVDARVDIYSLGCTLYFMLSGDAPFPQGTIPQRLLMHQSGEPADIRKMRPDAPEGLLAICRKMMAKKADDRYQSAGEVSAALGDWLGDGVAKAEESTRFVKTPPPLGPSQNEDLALAPLDDEPAGRGAARQPPQSKDSDSKLSDAGNSANTKPGSSVVSNQGEPSGIKKAPPSTTKNGTLSGVAKNGASAAANSSGKSGPHKISTPQQDEKDQFDELLAAPALPSAAHLQAAPHSCARKGASREPLPFMMLVGLGLGAGVGVLILIFFLIWLSSGF